LRIASIAALPATLLREPTGIPLEETYLEALPDGTVRGLTETGEFHLQRLHLNRPALVAHRLDLLERQQERERTARIETELEQVRQQRDALLQRVPRE